MKSFKKKLIVLLLVIATTFTSGTSHVLANSTYDEIYRNLVLLSSACRNYGYTNTAVCLDNAIVSYYGGSNGDLFFGSGTSFSNLVKVSSEYQSIRQQAINIAKGNRSLSYFTFSGSIALNSNTDLYLSLHNVSYNVTVQKMDSSSNYYLNITFNDYYDFAPAKWESYGGNPKSLITTYIVNYAYQAQCVNIIDPYYIYISTSDNFYIQ